MTDTIRSITAQIWQILKKTGQFDKIRKANYGTPEWDDIARLLDPLFNGKIAVGDRPNSVSAVIQKLRGMLKKENPELKGPVDIPDEEIGAESKIENGLFPHLTAEEKTQHEVAREAYKKAQEERERVLRQGASEVAEQEVLIDKALAGKINSEEFYRDSKYYEGVRGKPAIPAEQEISEEPENSEKKKPLPENGLELFNHIK